MAGHAAWDIETARALIGTMSRLDGAALPILHALQEEFGYVDRAAVPLIADALNLSRAEVLGTITFYHEFRQEPPGRRVVKLCRAEACQAVGCEDLVAHLGRQAIGLDTTSADGALTVETVYCLGNCALGPAALVDGTLVGRLDAERLTALCRGAELYSAQEGRPA
jgi:formate dehydrogenase subunit gamma